MKTQEIQLANGSILQLVSEEDQELPFIHTNNGGQVVELDLAHFTGKLLVKPKSISPPLIESPPDRSDIPKQLIPKRGSTTSEVTLDPYLEMSGSHRRIHDEVTSNGNTTVPLVFSSVANELDNNNDNSDVSPMRPKRQISVSQGLEESVDCESSLNSTNPLPRPSSDISPRKPLHQRSVPDHDAWMQLHQEEDQSADSFPSRTEQGQISALVRNEGTLDGVIDSVPMRPERQISAPGQNVRADCETVAKESVNSSESSLLDLFTDEESEFDISEARDQLTPLETHASLRLRASIREVESTPTSPPLTDTMKEDLAFDDSTPLRPERRESVEKNDIDQNASRVKSSAGMFRFAKKLWRSPSGKPAKPSAQQNWDKLLLVTGVRTKGRNIVEKRQALRNFTPTGLDINNAHPPKTQLHELCGRPEVSLDELQACLLSNPAACSEVDDNGRLPLHILGDNEALVGTDLGRATASAFCTVLFHSYPSAITTADVTGHYPFVRLIDDWLMSVYDEHKKTNDRDTDSHSGSLAKNSLVKRIRTFAIARDKIDDFVSKVPMSDNGHGMDDRNPSEERSSLFHLSARSYPRVLLWEEVEWALGMLSMAMDELAGMHGGLHSSTKNSGAPAHPVLMDLKDRDKLATHLMSVVPTLLKTIMLLEDNGEGTRQAILQSSLFRRCLLCPAAVGPWVCSMLRRKGLPSHRAVEFLSLISSTTVADLIGGFRTPVTKDYDQLKEVKKSVYEAVEATGGLVASLVTLDADDLKRAASTEVCWHLMGTCLSTPFVVALVLIDLVLHITLMMAFRNDVEVERDGDATAIGNVPTQVVVFICSHYFIRIASEALALMSISVKVFQKHFSNVWVFFNILAIIMALAAVVWNTHNEGSYRTALNSFVVGLLWLKVLGFLKVINREMSTFILALIQILKDLRYFMVVLVVVLLMFGDMLHLAVSTKDNGEFCSVNQEAGNLSSPAQDFCSNNQSDYYLRTYAMLLGDFELDDYKDTSGMEVLFVIFTMIGVVILLNVLIAVVSDSYEKASVSSRSLFGMARISFVAQNQALESFLKPGTRPLDSTDSRSKSLEIIGRVFRWTVLLAIIFTALNAELYLVTRAVSLIRANQSSVSILFFVSFLSAILAIALWAILTFTFESCCQSRRTSDNILEKVNKCCTNYFIGRISERLFGLNQTICVGAARDDPEWAGRVSHLERVIGKQIEAATKELRDEIHELTVSQDHRH